MDAEYKEETEGRRDWNEMFDEYMWCKEEECGM